MILDDILKQRAVQLKREKEEFPESEAKRLCEKLSRPARDFKGALCSDGISVIAEVKKASPSKGLICADFNPAKIAGEYEEAGANAVSVLTEEHYFMGGSKCLKEVRERISLPILRKDFIFDPYQIYEARAIGADAVLLIAAVLDAKTMREFKKIADDLSLHVLAEAHDERELYSVLEADCEIIGINNRNLKTFEVSLETTRELSRLVPDRCVLVSESGISTREHMEFLKRCGADAVLVGETLMRSGDVKKSLAELKGGL